MDETKAREDQTILVVEDNIDMLNLIGRILMEEGYRTILAADSTYGMAMLKESSPDLVMLDIRMPGMDGYAILQSIRQTSNVPVIMVTANWDTQAVQKSFDLGADDYIKKPFSPAELAARVKAKLRRPR